MRAWLAGALALAVSAMASKALAEPAAGASAQSEAGTPLQLRHDSPAAAQGGSMGAGWKLAGLALVAGVVAVWMRRRRAPQIAGSAPAPAMRIVSRAAVGVRSELLVVDVAGQRVLLGVTPSSIRHLVDLDAESAAATPEEKPSADVGPRFRALLDGALRPRAPSLPSPALSRHDPVQQERVEAQAKNLLTLRRR